MRKNQRNLNARATRPLLLLFSAVGAYLYVWQPVWLFHWREFRVGNSVITRVEAFRASHGRLPETLEEVGITDPDLTVYYCKAEKDEYYVWFGTTLGESETYDSRARKWVPVSGACPSR